MGGGCHNQTCIDYVIALIEWLLFNQYLLRGFKSEQYRQATRFDGDYIPDREEGVQETTKSVESYIQIINI